MKRLGMRCIKVVLSLLVVAMVTLFSSSAQYFNSRFVRESLRGRVLQMGIEQVNRSSATGPEAALQANSSERGGPALCVNDKSKQPLENGTHVGKAIPNQGSTGEFAKEGHQFNGNSDVRGTYPKDRTEVGWTDDNDERKGKKKKTGRRDKKSLKQKSKDDGRKEEKKKKKGEDASDSEDGEEGQNKARRAKDPSPDVGVSQDNAPVEQVDVKASVTSPQKDSGRKPLPKRILLVSSFRSGSSFLGELLAIVQRDTFYSYEPLHGYVARESRSNESSRNASQYLQDVLACRWDAHPQQVAHLSRQSFWKRWNQRLRAACEPADLCASAEFTSRVCRHSGLHVVKVVRLGLRDAQLLLDDPRNTDLKVVYLMRDPRGSLNSRWATDWCLNPECRDPETVCRQQLANLKLVPELLQRYPKRFKFVQYEELSMQPYTVVLDLWRFLDLKPSRKTVSILVRNTRTSSAQPYSTRRNSPCHAFSWRKKVNYTMLVKVQEACKDVISSLGMRLFSSEEEFGNLSLPVTLKGYSSSHLPPSSSAC